MAKIFPIDYEEKNSIAPGDFVLFSDAEDGDKIKKAQYSNLKGEKGDPGTAATITVGSTTTGTPGSSASVVNSGTTSAAVLDFTIPEGAKGDPGDPGEAGATIVSAEFDGDDMVFTESDGTTVTITDAKVDLKGDKGDTGNPGAAATIAVGTVTTLDPEDSATVTNSGTSSAAVFNFGIPKGDKGDKGDTGNPGSAATVTVGSTTTGAAGSCACVVNGGTSAAAVLNFTIPKGEKGDQGCKGDTGATGNGIASVTSSKAGKVTTVDITCTNGCSYCFDVCDGNDGEGAGDVSGPSSSTNGNLVLFDGNSGKCIKNGGAIANCLTSSSTTDVLSAKQGCVLNSCVSDINGKIPSAATSSNQLADKNYVDNSINSVTAYYITKNAAGDQFATYAELAAATTFYSGGVVRVPTRNDYTIVLDDETHSDEVTRYIYNSGWEYQYSINESPMTQAQLDALNSGITSAKVSTYDGYATSKQDTLTAGANISIASNKVSANNYFLVTEDIVTVSTDATKGVAPYNTSYGYTNIDIDASSGITWKEGAVYTFDVNTEMVVASAYRNVRVKIGNGAYIPVMGSSSILAGSSYFLKTNMRQYQYSTKYQSGGALHLFTDSNTTYSAMSNAEATTGTCTSGRSIAACTLKCAINYYAPISDTAYGAGWDGKTTTAPSQNAVYDKIESVVSSIPTVPANVSAFSNDAGYLTGTTGVTTVNGCHGAVTVSVPTDNCQLANGCGYTTCTGTLVPSDLSTYAKCTDIPTNNCQLTNGCGYTKCTGTISTCSQIISTLGYTPYNSTNPNGYTTCTGTLTQSAISDTAFGSSWNGDTTHAPSKNAVYDVLGDVETLLAAL